MIKKFLCAIIIMSMLFNVTYAKDDISNYVSHFNKVTEDYVPISHNTQGAYFIDLIDFEWAQQSIYELADLKVISGRGEGIFAPQDNIKINEFTKMLLLSSGLYDDTISDITPENDWSYKYMLCAEELKLLDCFEKDFNKERHITREEAAFMCVKVLEFYSFNLSDKTDALFTDDIDISPSVKESVYKLKNIGIISGMGDGTFMPRANLRRCEVAVMMLNLRNKIIEKL